MAGFTVAAQLEIFRNAIGAGLGLNLYEPGNVPDFQGLTLPYAVMVVGRRAVSRAGRTAGNCTVTAPVTVVYVTARAANTQSDVVLRGVLDTIANTCHGSKNWPGGDGRASGVIDCEVTETGDGSADDYGGFMQTNNPSCVAGHVTVSLTLDAS